MLLFLLQLIFNLAYKISLMEQSADTQAHQEVIRTLVAQGHDNVFIEQHLIEKGIDKLQVPELLASAKRMRHAMRTRKGSLLVVLGVLILGMGFISCVIIHNTGGEIGLPLYGLTILGLCIVFGGLVFIFQ